MLWRNDEALGWPRTLFRGARGGGGGRSSSRRALVCEIGRAIWKEDLETVARGPRRIDCAARRLVNGRLILCALPGRELTSESLMVVSAPANFSSDPMLQRAGVRRFCRGFAVSPAFLPPRTEIANQNFLAPLPPPSTVHFSYPKRLNPRSIVFCGGLLVSLCCCNHELPREKNGTLGKGPLTGLRSALRRHMSRLPETSLPALTECRSRWRKVTRPNAVRCSSIAVEIFLPALRASPFPHLHRPISPLPPL